ncbi:MAG: iron-sulfur cluster assembly accessory protein [Rhodobacterales bacterium CG15_BIG_FIL_POST_REV_8_21_14_020_59_13]|nr:MAG: iron-sulfur cluster assembly accessory protein [Rhodobacterales bacterium CG15_BIG_FIL_POST_REV_8_21_14_020_59_13]
MTAPQIELTARAAKRITAILESEKAGVMRISVEGGGCSGFSYKFGLDAAAADDDTVLERDGAKVAIDSASLPFLEDCTIDFADDLIGATFKIENPHATAACGCGVSFSI